MNFDFSMGALSEVNLDFIAVLRLGMPIVSRYKFGTYLQIKSRSKIEKSKHGIIRGIFLRFRNSVKPTSPEQLSIINYLYRSDIQLTFLNSNGLTRPIKNSVQPITVDLIDAQK